MLHMSHSSVQQSEQPALSDVQLQQMLQVLLISSIAGAESAESSICSPKTVSIAPLLG
jgi:hypothetical protein